MIFLILYFITFVNIVLSRNQPNTVDELDIYKYLGHWTQIYGSPTNVIFQGYGKCITADYGLLDNGYVSVLNAQINKNDEIEKINGYAYYQNISEPGKLTVHLDGVPVESPYWVVKLGEVVDNQYQYTIITTPSGISLWVLVRDKDTFYKLYDAEVRDFLDNYEYNYVTILQDNCQVDYNLINTSHNMLKTVNKKYK